MDYHWNSPEFYDYLATRGHKIVRMDFLWERIQPVLGKALSSDDVDELRGAVRSAAGAGLMVLLDMKNYGRYWLPDDREAMLGKGLTSEDFADAWRRIAIAFSTEPAVVGYGLMNEPWGLPKAPSEASGTGTTVWKQASQAAVEAIRSAGDNRSIFVAGDEWSGAWNWAGYNGDPWIDDPADNILYEAHLYFDANNSGAYADSYADTMRDALARGWPSLEARLIQEVGNFTSWLEAHDVRGFVGEIGWPSVSDATAWNRLAELVYAMLNDANVGATYWATGEWLQTDGGLYMLDAYNRNLRRPQSQTAVIEAAENLSRERAGAACTR